MEMLFPESFIQEVVGGGTNPSASTPSFTHPFANTNDFTYNTRVPTITSDTLDDTLVVYIDPAYSDSAYASATGIALCSAMGDKIVLLGLEQVKQATDIVQVNENIVAACVSIMVYVLLAHQHALKRCLIVIERNMAASASYTIAKKVNELLRMRLSDKIRVAFLHHRGTESCIPRIGYMLGAEKATIMSDMATLFNEHVLVASTAVQSLTLDQPVDELCAELSNFVQTPKGSYSGKTRRGKRDDLAVSFLMSCHFVLRRNNVDDLAFPL